MSKHKFTSAECRRGGKARAKQAADYRRLNPTPYENQVRQILDSLGVQYSPEFSLQDETTAINFYLDIAILQGDKLQCAIEIDGSNDWHNSAYCTKNAAYDELKAKCLHRLGVPLLQLRHFTDAEKITGAITTFLETAKIS